MLGSSCVRILALLALSVSPAIAQQQQVITSFGNGYAVGVPGQPPTLVQPFAGGYTIAQPGQAPTLVQPFGQGWIVTPPPGGEVPLVVPMNPSLFPQ